MNQTNMSELMQMTNQAAAQSDRWLFIASLVVCGAFVAGVMRYFVRQHERLIEDHKQSRDSYQASLRGMVTQQNEANQKLIVCLDNNSRVMEECRDELRLARIERSKQ